MCNLRIAGGACGVASRKVPIDFACETSRTELSSLSEKGDGDVYGTKHLEGKVGSELSPANYGGKEWWLLLEPVPA